MKVIIFYAKYGGGHLSAARSIENCINTYYKNVNVELIDFMEYANKEFNKITINDITEDCGVNRQTFYYHFKDIYDLLEWIFTNEVVKKIEKETTIKNWQENFKYVLDYMLENKKFIIKTYNSLSRKTLLDFLFKQYNTIFIDIINDEEGENGHIWTSMENYKKQVKNIANNLAKYNTENAEIYNRNADEYIENMKSTNWINLKNYEI